MLVPDDGGTPPPVGDSKFTNITAAAGNVTITWTGSGTLQSASSVAGPYSDVANAKSPYTSAASGAPKFYRFK